MNIVTLIGRITRDLKLYQTSTGKTFTFFTLAVNNIQNQADYISCVAWNKVAENMTNYLVKGSLISVSGRLSVRKSTNQEGKEQYITEVVAQTVTFLDNRKKDSAGNNVNVNYSKPKDENKIHLDDAFKNANYNTDINFTDQFQEREEDPQKLDFDEEDLIWDN
ncbi:single-stranded DNA-binding protein [Spiroplasma endosymbiont of Polydrusus pterygomalis]|uniref:single-stranded DNA-binding protein n=1 Tax=Spiroplasma endosymbiont of Polydrusus pterygomalis TaxID=3139327 RepID=UPI003CCA9B5B